MVEAGDAAAYLKTNEAALAEHTTTNTLDQYSSGSSQRVGAKSIDHMPEIAVRAVLTPSFRKTTTVPCQALDGQLFGRFATWLADTSTRLQQAN
jgi:hypothetical protein